MQFVDLQTQFEVLEQGIRTGIDSVLRHGKFIMGPEVYELEKRLARYVGVKYAISCSSGTDALLMALMAEKIGPGDAVFTTPFTFVATSEVISLLGATPIFVDIDSETFNIDHHKLLLAIEAMKKNDPSIYPLPKVPCGISALKPRGVIPVDIFGLPADYDPLLEIAGREGLFVLEDAAQSFGGAYKGRRAGGLGHAGATSFFPAKPLGCYGDGGAVFTDDEVYAEKLRSIRNHGQGSEKYDNIRTGLNGRLDTLQAAILLEKLKVFPDELASRQRIANKYTQLLSRHGITVQHIPDDCSSAWAQYSILSDSRDVIHNALKKEGIPSMIYYPKGLHQQTAYSGLEFAADDFPVTEKICERILSLPIHPYLPDEHIERICYILNEAM